MVPGTKGDDSFVLNIGKNKIESSTDVTSLGVKIDKQLKYKSHIEEQSCSEKTLLTACFA